MQKNIKQLQLWYKIQGKYQRSHPNGVKINVFFSENIEFDTKLQS